MGIVALPSRTEGFPALTDLTSAEESRTRQAKTRVETKTLQEELDDLVSNRDERRAAKKAEYHKTEQKSTLEGDVAETLMEGGQHKEGARRKQELEKRADLNQGLLNIVTRIHSPEDVTRERESARLRGMSDEDLDFIFDAEGEPYNDAKFRGKEQALSSSMESINAEHLQTMEISGELVRARMAADATVQASINTSMAKLRAGQIDAVEHTPPEDSKDLQAIFLSEIENSGEVSGNRWFLGAGGDAKRMRAAHMANSIYHSDWGRRAQAYHNKVLAGDATAVNPNQQTSEMKASAVRTAIALINNESKYQSLHKADTSSDRWLNLANEMLTNPDHPDYAEAQRMNMSAEELAVFLSDIIGIAEVAAQ